MAGSKIGAAKAVAKILEREPGYFRRIGQMGGRATGSHKGFGSNRELARSAGAKGGRISRRTKVNSSPDTKVTGGQ